jgi:Serine/threonine protein kinase
MFGYDVILGLEATEDIGLVILEAIDPGNIKQTYVGKCARKAAVSPEELEKLRKEADILKFLQGGSFIIYLHATHENEEHFLLVLENLPIQDLKSLRRMKELTESQIKFLAIETILGIEFIHSVRVVHRSIAPQHIGVDGEGHVAIYGFNLSDYFNFPEDTMFKICGVSHFTAPDVKRKMGYDKTVDWWSLGATLFYLLTGECPSWDDDGHLILQSISSSVSLDFVNLLEALLVRNPTNRLGAGGSEEIKNHPFFEGVDWIAYDLRLATPPDLL